MLAITHNAKDARFEYTENGLLCLLSYSVNENTMSLLHTAVPTELGGRGIAAQLTEAAIAYAKAQNLKLKPVCSYSATYLQRHPEHHNLLAS